MASQRNRKVFSVTAVLVQSKGEMCCLGGCFGDLKKWIQCLVAEDQKTLSKALFYNTSLGSLVLGRGRNQIPFQKTKISYSNNQGFSPMCLKPKWTESHWAAKP